MADQDPCLGKVDGDSCQVDSHKNVSRLKNGWAQRETLKPSTTSVGSKKSRNFEQLHWRETFGQRRTWEWTQVGPARFPTNHSKLVRFRDIGLELGISSKRCLILNINILLQNYFDTIPPNSPVKPWVKRRTRRIRQWPTVREDRLEDRLWVLCCQSWCGSFGTNQFRSIDWDKPVPSFEVGSHDCTR